MKPTWERSERNQVVRDAACNWEKMHFIDQKTLAAILDLYPDEGHHVGLALRIVAFVVTLIAIGAAFLLCTLLAGIRGENGFAVLSLVLGITLWAAREIFSESKKILRSGMDTAAILGGAFLLNLTVILMMMGVFHMPESDIIRVALFSGIVIFSFAAVRYDSASSAAAAVGFLGAFLTRFPMMRLTWVIFALLIIPLALRGSESGRLSPSRRLACSVILVAAIIGLYTALHIGSWDLRILEGESAEVYVNKKQWGSIFLRRMFQVTTALVPLVVTAFAVFTRRRLLLIVGLFLSAASLVTLRVYVHIAPLWVVLSVAGLGLIGIVLGVKRWLEGGIEGERRGWTARPLQGKSLGISIVESAVAIAAATPRQAQEPEPGFQGSGGRSGGAGAGGEF